MRTRLSLIYGALFVLVGVQHVYLPVWLDWKGFSATEIAWLIAVPMVLRIGFMPAIGVVSDSRGDAVGVGRLLAFAALLFSVLLALGASKASLALLVVALLLVSPSLLPLVETTAMAAVRQGQAEYGKVRLWGSLTFILANMAGGVLIDRMGAGSIGWLVVFGAGLLFAALHLLPRRVRGAGEGLGKSLGVDALTPLLRHRVFVLLVATAGLLQASHAVFYVYGVLHWRSLGYSTTFVGMLWAVGVIVEIGLFQVGRRVLATFGAVGLIVAGGVAGVVRWGIMAFDPWLPLLVLLQATHALTYAATHIGTLHLVSRLVPDELAGSAQALLATFTASIAMSVAIVLAGALYPSGGALSYLAMAAISAVGLIAALRLRRDIGETVDR
ncbi:MAG: hypothetical protein RLZ98_2873 [Pseudomonadota bacterium]|jgi:PPP family 3-phenylpropionic acid transporter